MKKNYFLILFLSIFTLIGIGLLFGGIALSKNAAHFREIAEEVSAKIIRIEDYYDSDGDMHHNVYVTYTYNGQVYDDIRITFYNSGMFEGKEISLLCDPESPKHVMSTSFFNTGASVLLFMGIIFASVGVVPLIIAIVKKCKKNNLKEKGAVLYATVELVDINTNYTVNGRNPYVIYCTYKDEYKDILYRFKSDNLWTDPSPVFPIGSEIEVLVNPKDYSNYHVKAEEVVSQRIADYT